MTLLLSHYETTTTCIVKIFLLFMIIAQLFLRSDWILNLIKLLWGFTECFLVPSTWCLCLLRRTVRVRNGKLSCLSKRYSSKYKSLLFMVHNYKYFRMGLTSARDCGWNTTVFKIGGSGCSPGKEKHFNWVKCLCGDDSTIVLFPP